MQEFIKKQRAWYEEESINFMLPIFDLMIERCIDSEEELQAFVDERLAFRNSHERFSMEYMHQWSIYTYVEETLYRYRMKL